MTLLHALEHPAAHLERPRVARSADLWRVAHGRAAALAGRRPRGLRTIARGSFLTTALQLIGPVSRGEVWVTGVGTSLVVTPHTPAREAWTSARRAAAAQIGLVLLLPVGLAGACTWIGGAIGVAGPALALLYLVGLLLPLVCCTRTTRSTRVDVVRPGSSGRVVRLHDLVRHPSDPAGTGVALLAAVLNEPLCAADTVHAAAATEDLADRYVGAGMTRVTARSRLGDLH